MRHSSRITVVTALTAALTLVAAPALANGSGQSVSMPPWLWYIAAGGGEWGVAEGSYNDIEADISVTNAWDSSQLTLFGPSYVPAVSAPATLEPAAPTNIVPFECVSTTLTSSGDDQVVACNETLTTPWGLSVTSDVRVLAPGDLARITFLVTNTTASPVALGYEYSWNYGQSFRHVRSSEPGVEQITDDDSDGFLASPDVWSYNRSTINAGVAWGIAGQPYVGTDSYHGGYDEARVQLLPSDGRTIAAGETIALAFFHKMQEPQLLIDDNPGAASTPSAVDPAASDLEQVADDATEASVPQPASSHVAETPASFMNEFSSFSGRLTRGLPADISVGNWQPAATPELADTGAGVDETLIMGGIAAALLGAGAALIIGRRGARANRR